MAIKRKSHNLDAQLLARARRALGARTETDTIHQALRAVLVGDDVVRDLEAARSRRSGRDLFHVDFLRAQRLRTK
jgi:Arc/MetJ family transcription regulator